MAARYPALLFLLAWTLRCVRGVDVAIVGGGPGGLSAAIAIRRALGPEVRVRVFERAEELRDVGAHVGLLPVAFRALDALDPTGGLSERVEAAGDFRTLLRRFDAEGTLLEETEFRPDSREERVLVVPWHRLRKVLADELPEDVVRLGYELTSVEVSDDDDGDGRGGANLTFSNGERCRAAIVIGADGNMSRVRACLFDLEEDAAPVVYAGSVIWRMILSGRDVDGETGVSDIWAGDGKVLVLQKFGAGDSARVYLSGQASWPENRLHILDRQYYSNSGEGNVEEGKVKNDEKGGNVAGGIEGSSNLVRFLNTFRGFPRVGDASAHCDAESILEHPIYFRPPGRPWGTSRVTLLGDAAHVMPPNGAMGVPMALEDSVALAHALARHGCGARALREYERERMQRVNTIAAAVIRQSTGYYRDKNEEENPFKVGGDLDLLEYIVNFHQDPLKPTSSVE